MYSSVGFRVFTEWCSITTNSLTLSSLRKERNKPIPQAVSAPVSSSSSPGTTNPLPVGKTVSIRDISQKQSHTVCGRLCLASSIWHIFKAHLYFLWGWILYGSITISKWENILWKYHQLFTHSSADVCSGCFHILVIVNTAMNIYTQFFVWTLDFFALLSLSTPETGASQLTHLQVCWFVLLLAEIYSFSINVCFRILSFFLFKLALSIGETLFSYFPLVLWTYLRLLILNL